MNEKSNTNRNSDGDAPSLSLPASPRNIRVFMCYRRQDGARHAEWLNDHLSDTEYTDADGNPCQVRIYYDRTAPGVSDWKKLHFPSLQSSQGEWGQSLTRDKPNLGIGDTHKFINICKGKGSHLKN